MKYQIETSPDGRWLIADVWKRGHAILTDPLLNKGTAFTQEERRIFELEGLLPHQVTNRAAQVQRAYEHVREESEEPIESYVALAALQDRNETLFYQVLAENIEELIPIVYTPTVGTAALRFSHLFRRGRGLWITPEHRGRIYDVLGHTRCDDVQLIVVTDNERILGLGDQGAGGMVIPIGKLALYTLGAGIHPAFTLPVSLDVGTDNPALLDDELYVGWRHPRLRGDEYDSLLEEFVDAVGRRWPNAVLQWEDFKKANAFRLLDRYRTRLPSFNDDIQGTAAVVTAGLHAASLATGTKMAEQRVLLVGAGAAGVGIARQLRHTMERAGGATEGIALFDTHGVVGSDRPSLEPFKADVAWSEVPEGLQQAGADLTAVVDAYRPTAIVGTTGQPGIFDEAVITAMASHVERPIVMALSNPTSKTEAHPADVVRWTDGRALIATGSPFEPVVHGDQTVHVSQCNNVYVFPGVGLGTIVSGARTVTDGMFGAAAEALAELVSPADLTAGVLYPPLEELRPITRRLAGAVARAARADGVGRRLTDAELEAALDRHIWDLDYLQLRPV